MSWFKLVLPANATNAETRKFNMFFTQLYRDGNPFLGGRMLYFQPPTEEENSITYYFAPECYVGLNRYIEPFNAIPCEKPNVVTLQRYQPAS